ncbi:MAG: sodium:proton exchanger [Gammaproteobacteria bacterium]|nr:sodium:proton exchanger [Gammaproteobacteria bacterium]|tara:strand:- start:2682 stop:3629 length:948 start_codon:yes stop_codon:yes gene_type:complete
MTEVLDVLRIFGGFVYLLLGGDFLVRGALGLSRESSIPPVVVGLTVVAMGTSAPELMVSAFSALSGFPGIAIGNVVGSNIANVLLVIGVPVLIHSISCTEETLPRQTGLMIGVTLMFMVMCYLTPLGTIDGIILLLVLAGFLTMTVRGAAVMPLDDAEDELERVLGLPGEKWSIALLVVLGMITLPLGANLAVEGAAGLAKSWGVTEAVIGLSIIALGTSLPELSTTVIAALHKSSDVALGNVVGSNLFNILLIMGFTSVLTEVPVDSHILRFDIWVMLLASVVLWMFVLARGTIGKAMGVIFLASYGAYIFAIY